MKVRFTPFALAELDAIFTYIEARNPPAADRVKTRILRLIDLLKHAPRIGSPTDREGVRMLVAHSYPYLIFYSVDDDRREVRILDIRHGARRRR
jgi:plasmid stabilization system protein ParE